MGEPRQLAFGAQPGFQARNDPGELWRLAPLAAHTRPLQAWCRDGRQLGIGGDDALGPAIGLPARLTEMAAHGRKGSRCGSVTQVRGRRATCQVDSVR